MSLEDSNVATDTVIAKSKSITFAFDRTVPEPAWREAVEPAYKYERTAPENGDSEKTKADPPHDASLD